MNESFSIQEVRQGAVRILRLAGRLDARASATLTSRCQQARDPRCPLVLVLKQVDFMSSSGVGTLLALAEEFREAGATLLLAAPSEAVSISVGLLNLGEFLVLHETEQVAIERLAA